MEVVSFVYITMFALTTTTKFEVGKYFAEMCESSNLPSKLMLNLSSANLTPGVWSSVRTLVSCTSVIFSNVQEIRAVGLLHFSETN